MAVGLGVILVGCGTSAAVQSHKSSRSPNHATTSPMRHRPTKSKLITQTVPVNKWNPFPVEHTVSGHIQLESVVTRVSVHWAVVVYGATSFQLSGSAAKLAQQGPLWVVIHQTGSAWHRVASGSVGRAAQGNFLPQQLVSVPGPDHQVLVGLRGQVVPGANWNISTVAFADWSSRRHVLTWVRSVQSGTSATFHALSTRRDSIWWQLPGANSQYQATLLRTDTVAINHTALPFPVHAEVVTLSAVGTILHIQGPGTVTAQDSPTHAVVKVPWGTVILFSPASMAGSLYAGQPDMADMLSGVHFTMNAKNVAWYQNNNPPSKAVSSPSGSPSSSPSVSSTPSSGGNPSPSVPSVTITVDPGGTSYASTITFVAP